MPGGRNKQVFEKARAFLNPEAVAEASKAAGVLDFEWHFVENVEGYSV